MQINQAKKIIFYSLFTTLAVGTGVGLYSMHLTSRAISAGDECVTQLKNCNSMAKGCSTDLKNCVEELKNTKCYSALTDCNSTAKRCLSALESSNALLKTGVSVLEESRSLNKQLLENRIPLIFNLFPEFLLGPYPPSKAEKASLEAILQNRKVDPQTIKNNTCWFYNDTLSSWNGKARLSSTVGVFLNKDWLLLPYHSFMEEDKIGPRLHLILTSKGDVVESSKNKIYIYAASPREDLALVKINRELDYIKTVSLPLDIPSYQENLVKVNFKGKALDKLTHLLMQEFQWEGPKSAQESLIPILRKTKIGSAKISGDITVSKEGGLSYRFASFSSASEKGESGSPIYDSHGYLRGILVNSSKEFKTSSYSPRIRPFLERCLKEFNAKYYKK